MAGDLDVAERALHRELFDRYPAEAVRRLETMTPEAVAAALGGLPPEVTAPVWELLAIDVAASAIGRVAPDTAGAVLGRIDPRLAGQILAGFDDDRRAEIMAAVARPAAQAIESMMSYPPGTAGAMMDPRIFGFRTDMTVGQAVDRLRASGRRGVRIGFIVGSDRRLQGQIEIQDLALSPADAPLSEVQHGPVAVVGETATAEEVFQTLDRFRLTDLPVVDFDGRLIGVVRQSALIDAAESEISAALQTMVGVSKEERALSRVWFSVGKRLPWLQINLLTAFLAAAVVGAFESTIAKYTALAVLLPVVAGQSGNTGAQALAVTMRGLALREIQVGHWTRVLNKELWVGLVNGVAVAVTTSIGVLLWSGSGGLGLVIFTSMILSMVIAGLSGAAVPIVLTAARQDPAASSSIVLTTVTDICGFFSFLGIATLLSGMLPA